jgi:hypothetical protein
MLWKEAVPMGRKYGYRDDFNNAECRTIRQEESVGAA